MGACETMRKICLHYSENSTPFALTKDKENKILEEAKDCNKIDFVKVDNNILWYKNKYYIYLEPRFCSCPVFLENALCKHHVAAFLIENHIDSKGHQFTIAKPRGRPKKSKGALNY